MRLTGLWWWIDRWRKSTAYTDMTLEQQGAYRNLLDEAALRGGPLPNDDRILGKASGDALAWKRLKAVVLAKFDLKPDGWRNETLDAVILESERRAEKQRRYRNVHGNGGGNDNGNASGNGGGNGGGNGPPLERGNETRPPDPDPDPDPKPSPDPNPVNRTIRSSGLVPTVAHEKPPAPSVPDAGFERFWAVYPKKKGKKAAMKEWRHLKPSDSLVATIETAISWQATCPDWQREGGRFIPNPATWLHQGRWDDEPITTSIFSSSSPKTAGNAAAVNSFAAHAKGGK